MQVWWYVLHEGEGFEEEIKNPNSKQLIAVGPDGSYTHEFRNIRAMEEYGIVWLPADIELYEI